MSDVYFQQALGEEELPIESPGIHNDFFVPVFNMFQLIKITSPFIYNGCTSKAPDTENSNFLKVSIYEQQFKKKGNCNPINKLWPLQKKTSNVRPCSLFIDFLPTESCLKLFSVETHVSLAKLAVYCGKHLHFEREVVFEKRSNCILHQTSVTCKQGYLISKWFYAVVDSYRRENIRVLDMSRNITEVVEVLGWILRN